MKYELIINNERILLQEKQKITITKQVNNLGELKDRQTTYTNKFKARKTSRLTRLLNGLGVVGNTSRTPYIINNCKLIINDIEILSNGNCYVTTGTKDYFSFTIYDGNIYFFQQIGSNKLSELDYTDLNHQLTPTNYIDSFGNDNGYIYAVSDNGKIKTDFTTDKIEINYQLASVYVKTIWSKIFDSTDFDFEFIDFDDRKFTQLALTPKRGYNAEVDAVSNPFQLSYSNYLQTDNTGVDPYDIFGTGYNWQSKVINFSPNYAGINGGYITINETGNYNIDLNLDYSLTFAPITNFRLLVIVNGDVINPSYVYYGTEVSTNNWNVNIDVNVPFNAGDIVHLRYDAYIDIPPIFNGTHSIDVDFDFEPSVASVIDLDFKAFIGDLTQKNFFKAIMQHFGFVMQPKRNTKTYQFKRMQDILTDTVNAYDWSNRFVEEIKEEYQLKGYSQLNRMAYQYFDANSDKFADGFLQVDNLNLKTEGTLFTSPFNACDTSNVLLNNSIITSTPFWSAQRDDEGNITEYKPINNKNYLAEVKKVNETIKYGLTDGTAVSYTGLVPRLDFSNLNYNNVINENYDRLGVVLDWNNVKQIEVRLTAKEVVDFDFFKLVYIDKLASYFYVNSIKYKGESKSIVEVVRVKKENYVCDLVANAGSYTDVPKANPTMQLNGVASQGNVITTWLWEVVSEPVGSSATITDSSESVATLNFLIDGDYTIRLTISNANCSSVSETIITKLP